jgi:bifunctional enzyme CysN/CysC
MRPRLAEAGCLLLGQIRNFTGVDAPYEVPFAPDVRLATIEASAGELAERVVEELRALGVTGG